MKFINSWADPLTKKSTVKIQHLKEFFYGNSTLHPDDEWSDLTGCRYAEMRAKIKALKFEYKQKKHDCEECRKFVAAVQQYAKFNPEDPSARAMFRQLNRRIKEVNKLADKINEMEFNLQIAIRNQDKVKKHISKKD